MQYRCEAAYQLSSSRSCSAANVTRCDHAFMPWQHFSRYQVSALCNFAFEPDHAGSPPITQLLVDALPRHPDQARKIALRNSEIDANRITIFAAVDLGQPKKLSRKPRTRIEKNGILDQGLA